MLRLLQKTSKVSKNIVEIFFALFGYKYSHITYKIGIFKLQFFKNRAESESFQLLV